MANPTIDQWFNTSAFSIPVTGSFGNSSRNIMYRAGFEEPQLEHFTRSVRLGGNRNAQAFG